MAGTNPRSGSSFDDFLEEEGLYDDVSSIAIKRVIVRQLAQAMEVQQISKAEMARRLNTSRTQLNRLLDPDNHKVQLDTLQRAASVVGRRLRVELEDKPILR